MIKFVRKRILACGHALNGFRYFYTDGVHAKIMLVAAALVLLAGWMLNISTFEWLTIIICCGLVLTAEALNSALEYLTDLCSPEFHPLAKKTKDVAAASVLIASFVAAVTGCVIFIPKLFS